MSLRCQRAGTFFTSQILICIHESLWSFSDRPKTRVDLQVRAPASGRIYSTVGDHSAHAQGDQLLSAVSFFHGAGYLRFQRFMSSSSCRWCVWIGWFKQYMDRHRRENSPHFGQE